MADEKFRLPGSSYEELAKIIKAYGQTKGPARPGDVAGLIGVHETIVSRNNGFLRDAPAISHPRLRRPLCARCERAERVGEVLPQDEDGKPSGSAESLLP